MQPPRRRGRGDAQIPCDASWRCARCTSAVRRGLTADCSTRGKCTGDGANGSPPVGWSMSLCFEGASVMSTQFAGPMSIDKALACIRQREPVTTIEDVSVDRAVGRILAEDVVAASAVPAHDSSAMDGYAFRYADLDADRRLPLVGRVTAGHPLAHPLPARSAVRIFTGAVMPEGADTVAMQEFSSDDGDYVTLPDRLAPGDNRRHAGEDIKAGTTVLTAGTRLRSQDVGIAAGVGRTTLWVRRPVRVGVLATGDELRPAGAVLPTGCIHDSNRVGVIAALRNLGAEVTDYGIVGDSESAVRAVLRQAAHDNDLIISSGGVSAGDEDHVRAAVVAEGRLEFWRLPLKPGRPVAMGTVGKASFLGLPGNPVSALVTFWLLGRPLTLRHM